MLTFNKNCENFKQETNKQDLYKIDCIEINYAMSFFLVF